MISDELFETLRPLLTVVARRRAAGYDPEDLEHEMWLTLLEEGEQTFVRRLTNDPRGRKCELVAVEVDEAAPADVEPLLAQAPSFIAQWALGRAQKVVRREHRIAGRAAVELAELADLVHGEADDPVAAQVAETTWIEWAAEEIACRASTARTRITPELVLATLLGWMGGEPDTQVRRITGLSEHRLALVRTAARAVVVR